MSNQQAPPTISELPDDIKHSIFEYVDIRSRCSIRQCCKDFKTAIENTVIHFESLLFDWNCEERCIRLSATPHGLPAITLDFHDRFPNGFIVTHHNQGSGKVITTGNFIDAAVEKFVKLLARFQKIRVKRLEINFRDYFERSEQLQTDQQQILNSLEKCLMHLNRLVSVKELVMRTDPNQHDILRVLRFLKPATLESITLRPRNVIFSLSTVHHIDLDSVATTPQWRKAKVLKLEPYYLPSSDTSNFETITGNLSFFQNNEVERCIQNFLLHNNWKERIFRCIGMNFKALAHYLIRNGFLKIKDDSIGLGETNEVYALHRGETEVRIRLCHRYLVKKVVIWNPQNL